MKKKHKKHKAIMLRSERPVSHRLFNMYLAKITKNVRHNVISYSNMYRQYGDALTEHDVYIIIATSFKRIAEDVYNDRFDIYTQKSPQPPDCYYIKGSKFPLGKIQSYINQHAGDSGIDFRPPGPYNIHKDSRISLDEYVTVRLHHEKERWLKTPPHCACTNKGIRRRVTIVCSMVSRYMRDTRNEHEKSQPLYYIDLIRIISKILYEYSDAMKYNRWPDTPGYLSRTSSDVLGLVHKYLSNTDLLQLALVDRTQSAAVRCTFKVVSCMVVGRVVGVANAEVPNCKGIVLPCGNNGGTCIDRTDSIRYKHHVGYHIFMENGTTKWVAKHNVRREITFNASDSPGTECYIKFGDAPWESSPHMEYCSLNILSHHCPPSSCYIVNRNTPFPDVSIGDIIDVNTVLSRNRVIYSHALTLERYTREPWWY